MEPGNLYRLIGFLFYEIMRSNKVDKMLKNC